MSRAAWQGSPLGKPSVDEDVEPSPAPISASPRCSEVPLVPAGVSSPRGAFAPNGDRGGCGVPAGCCVQRQHGVERWERARESCQCRVRPRQRQATCCSLLQQTPCAHGTRRCPRLPLVRPVLHSPALVLAPFPRLARSRASVRRRDLVVRTAPGTVSGELCAWPSLCVCLSGCLRVSRL